MVKYLKRGILCLMAFLSLFVLFTSFYRQAPTFFDECSFSREHPFCSVFDDSVIAFFCPRGVWFITGGIDALSHSPISYFIRLFKTDFMNFIYLALFYLEFFGALAICGLAVMVLIKGDNGIFSKIIMFGSLAIIFLYAGQVFVYCWNPVHWSSKMPFFEKLSRFFNDPHGWAGMSKLPIVLFVLNAILCAGYFFMGKMMPEAE